jgi:apolipoprotein N-acyltransferase
MKNSSARFAPLVLAAAYPLAEIASASVIGFSWHSIGYSPLGTPLSALLPFVGVHGVAAASMLLCALPVSWWIEWRRAPLESRRLPWRGAAILSSVVIVLALLSGTSYLRMTVVTAQPVRVRLLQPAQPLHRKFDSARARAIAQQLVALARDESAHLVVAPETSLPHSWATMPSDLGDSLLGVVKDSDRVFLVGLFDMSESGGLLNVSTALRSDSRLVLPQRYAKRHLVPVAEQVTPGLRWVSDALALPFADREADEGEPVLFVTPRAIIRTTICLDLVYGADLSDGADAVELFVNQSNLAALPGERVRAQFTTIARARALEQQKPVLLVANDGPTAVIDADGHVLASLPYGTAAGLSARVQPRHGATLYARLGESGWLVLLSFAALAMAVIKPRLTNRDLEAIGV